MPKVKLVFQNSFGTDSFITDATDWQDISNDDLSFLKDNLRLIEDDRMPYYSVRIAVLDDIDISERIKFLREKIAKDEADKILSEQKEVERKEAKRIAREKKTLEKLQKKYVIDQK
jgi:hypothetical protein